MDSPDRANLSRSSVVGLVVKAVEAMAHDSVSAQVMQHRMLGAERVDIIEPLLVRRYITLAKRLRMLKRLRWSRVVERAQFK